MADITLAQLTNVTKTSEGTGVLDVLMQSVDIQADKQFKLGRIKGDAYATFYLGAMQSALQASLTFILEEQKAGKEVELIESQILESNEKIDAIIAETAKSYEAIKASEANTLRENQLSNKQILKIQKEIILLETQISELTANGLKDRLIKDQQELKLVEEVTRTQEEIDLLQQKFLTEQAQTVTPTAGLLKAQYDLQQAQKTAFKARHLAEVQKQMLDSFATVYAVTDGAPTGGIPAFLSDANAIINTHVTETKDAMDLVS